MARVVYLLDTNTVSYLVRRHPAVCAKLLAVPMAEVGISAITEAEIRYGLAKQPGHKLHSVISELLLRVEVLAWDGAAAACYGELRAALERAGTPLGNLDVLIAAHALAVGAVLVSNDQAFRRVPGLQVVDWSVG